MKTTLRLALTISLTLAFTACLAVQGQFGYTDPKTGATVGFTVGNGPSGKSAKPVKAAVSFRTNPYRVTIR